MPSPISLMKRPCGTGMTPSAASRRHVLRAADSAVLDAVAVIGTRMGREGVPVDVEHGGDGAVADGVGGHLPARPVGAGDGPAQALDVHLEEAAIAGLALEVAAHRGGAADQRAVGEDLHRADPQPLVAPAGAKAEVEAEAVAVRGGVRQVVERLGRDHQGGAHAEAALPARLLPGRQLHRAARDEPAAHARLLHAGEPLAEIVLARAPDGLDQLRLRVRVDQRADEGLRLLLQEPGGAPGRVALDHAALGHRDPIDADRVEHAPAHHAHVARGVAEPDQVVGRDRVELRRARVPPLARACSDRSRRRRSRRRTAGSRRGPSPRAGCPPRSRPGARTSGTSASPMPKDGMWLCASWKPGTTV